MTRPRSSTRIVVAAALMSALTLVAFGGTAATAATVAGPTCQDSWTNPAGGDWFTPSNQPSNWSTGEPPTSSEYACINIALSGPVLLNEQSTTIGGLSLGNTSGSGGTDVLELENATLSLTSNSNVTRAGEITQSSGTLDSLDVEGSSVLTNDGTMYVWGIWGNVTNEPDGFVSVPDGTDTVLFTGTFTNLGEFTVQAGSSGLYIPYEDSTGAVFDNAGGVLQNQSVVYVNAGGTFEEGAGAVVGVPAAYNAGIQITGGTLDLTGSGPSSFEIESGFLRGKVAAGQTLVLVGGGNGTQATGSITNNGTIFGESTTLTIPSDDTLTNKGSIVVPTGNSFDLDGDVTNAATGTIAVAATSSTGANLTLGPGDILSNDGTVAVGPLTSGSLDAGDGTIDNAGGTIANAGQVDVPDGGTLVEGNGATAGSPIFVDGGTLDMTGSGAASVELQGGTISGNVAHGQTLELLGGGGTTDATGSFTNGGTLVANSTLSLPSGDTLTNDGTIEDGDGVGANGFTMNGNLTNATGGVIGEDGAGVQMTGYGTTFDNAGTLYDLYQNNVDVNLCNHPPCDNTFENTGTIYEGTNSSGAEWGGGAYASNVSNTGTGDTVDLAGTIVPVPDGEPSGGTGSAITYGLTNGAPGSPPAWTLSCSAGVTSGWSLACSNDSGAVLTEPKSSTLEPTEVSVTGSGTSESYGWESSYGQPVTLTATVSAEDAGTPTGTVAFFAAQQNANTLYGLSAAGPDLLGTGTLSTHDGVATATLTTSSLPPGKYQLLGLYSGDSADLAASSVYSSSVEQVVAAQTTTIALTSSSSSPVFGSPLILTATVTPGGYGPANPTGVVTIFDGSTVIGSAPVVTKSGVTKAVVISTALPVGSDSLTADYAGDYNYGASTSPMMSQSVFAPTAPSEVMVSGPSTIKAGKTYTATASTDGTGAVLFALASTPAPPKGMTINGATGAVSFKVPKTGLSNFSYAVVASNAAGQAQSSVVTVGISAGAAVLTLAAVTAAQPPTCADSWTNPAGGTWATGTDWSNGAPPTPSQYACITIALSAPVVLSGNGTSGGLTLGGTGGSAELELNGATLVLSSASSVTRTGEIATGAGGGTIEVASSAALANDGVIDAAGSFLDLYGDLTNDADGWVSVASALAVDTGTLTNSGELTVQPGATLEAPANGGTGAVIDNAAGAIQNQGAVDVGQGATFQEAAGSVIGTAPVIGSGGSGALDLIGAGTSTFELVASCCEIPTVSGNVTAGQTLRLAGTVEATGSFTNDGTITTASNATLVLPATKTLTNAGSIVVAPGTGLTIAGNVDNQGKGTIAVAAGSGSASSLSLSGPVILTNDGSVDVGTGSSLNAGSNGSIVNTGGTIGNAGSVTIGQGAGFTEDSGTTTGNPVVVQNGSLRLTGGGSSSFWVVGAGGRFASISGNIAKGQTVAEGGVNAAGSFTNDGTLIGRNAPLSLPSGDTLTNDGTIEANSGFVLDGNLTNAAGGVIGEASGVSLVDGTGNTFDNAGILYLLLGAGEVNLDCNQGYPNNTFVNTGTIYWGIDSSGVEWGGDAFNSSSVCGGSGSTVDVAGTVVPVPTGEPSGGSGPIAYSVGPSTSTITWSPSVTSGWTAGSGYLGAAALIEPESSTLEPTDVSVTGSGTSESYGWASSYGQPVTLTATVSAANGSAPTGTVTFFALQQNSGIPNAISPDLIGTGSLSTSGDVTTATLTTSSLPAGTYQLAALYGGDSAHLAAWSQYSGSVEQQVSAETASIALTSSSSAPVFGSPLTLTATVAPGAFGPANPTGVVTFFDGSLIVGQAPVVTKSGVTKAVVITTALPVGSDSLTADYAGDYNYVGSTSPALSQSVSASTAPSEVTVTGPSKVTAGKTYTATASTDGTGAVLFALSSTPVPPKGMTINGATGAVLFKVPKTGLSSFSYAVVASNAVGEAQSALVTVQVKT